jgi:hypothetical protein
MSRQLRIAALLVLAALVVAWGLVRRSNAQLATIAAGGEASK